jgi:hypothetical protein
MSTVFIWLPGKDSVFGHASLAIGPFVPNTIDPKNYVSWWPSGSGASVLSMLPGVKHRMSVNNWSQDLKDEGRMPDTFVYLDELDIDKMKAEWWSIMTKPHAHYRLARKNCATIVARVLIAGGAEKYSQYANLIHVWRPKDVLMFAYSIRVGLRGGQVG